MSDHLPPASPPEAFMPLPDRAAVELPASRGADGKPLVVHIKRLPIVDILRAHEGLPVPSGQTAPDGATAAANVAAMEGTMRAVAALGVAGPEKNGKETPLFDFGQDGAQGLPKWDDLPWADRSAIFDAIGALAGLSALPPNVRSFRGGPVRKRAGR